MTDLTEGLRIYAIGDVHGRLDLLTEMLARIRADLARRPHPRPQLIFLGDYMDRGPESRGVLEALIALKASDLPARFLLGNHDSYVSAYLRDPDWYDRTYHWLADNMGGNATLASYGVPDASARLPAATRDAFAAAFPPEHLAFLDACELAIRLGGYLFVHAGIRPGVPLAAQTARRSDLDPRSVPDLDRRLRLQGGARPHHRAGGRAPPQPDRDRHRGGPHRRALLPAARGRQRGAP